MNEQEKIEERGVRSEEGLQALGKKTEYRMDYAPEVLETFENKHPDNDYWVQFNCPEFTSLCPITGQPDFAEIKILYIPGRRMVESKSLKLYLFSFRNHGDFHEDCVNIIMKASCNPNTSRSLASSRPVVVSPSIPMPTTASPAQNMPTSPSADSWNIR